jgi:hypothetical protein
MNVKPKTILGFPNRPVEESIVPAAGSHGFQGCIYNVLDKLCCFDVVRSHIVV